MVHKITTNLERTKEKKMHIYFIWGLFNNAFNSSQCMTWNNIVGRMLKDVLPNFEVALHLHGGGDYGKSQNTSELSLSKTKPEYAAALLTTRLRYATTGQRSQVTGHLH